MISFLFPPTAIYCNLIYDYKIKQPRTKPLNMDPFEGVLPLLLAMTSATSHICMFLTPTFWNDEHHKVHKS